MNIPWVESPLFDQHLRNTNYSEEQKEAARFFYKNGYFIIDDVLAPGHAEEIIRETERLFPPDVTEGPRSRYRCQDAWEESKAVVQLSLNPKILEWLRFFYQRRPIPFQTLNFRTGSQQRAHSDTIHFSCLPQRFMCGVWVALEDVTEKNGPLFYYPGSQRLPEFQYMDIFPDLVPRPGDNQPHDYARYESFLGHLMEAEGFQVRRLIAAKGTALIWASNLVHGGSPITDPSRTRWSQVTHYFFENCLYYTPMLSNRVSGEYALRELVDIGTRERIQGTYNGRDFARIPSDLGRFRIHLP